MTSAELETLAKARRHILPLLFAGYMFAILDRGNISFAALQMNEDLGLSATAFGWATAAFYVGYLAFEIPSNMLLQRFGARIWIARIMFTWGLATGLMAFVGNAHWFVVLRFLLGASEAGFLPGVIFYLTLWFPAAYRQKVTTDFTLSIPIMSAIGAVLSSSLLALNGWGLKGWQWLFLIEAIPPLLLAVAILAYLPSKPADARFLTDDEKRTVARLLEAGPTQNETSSSLKASLLNPAIWLLGLINLGFILAMYTMSVWMPQIVKGMGFGLLQTGILVAIPQIAGVAAMLLWSRTPPSWRAGSHVLVVPLAVAALALFVATLGVSLPIILIGGITIATGAIYAAIPAFWTAVMNLIDRRQAAVSIALINTIGSFSGVLGPPVVGFIKDTTNSFAGAFAMATICVVISIMLTRIATRRWQPAV